MLVAHQQRGGFFNHMNDLIFIRGEYLTQRQGSLPCV